MMERVLNNLIDNAIKHTPEEGEVDIQLETTGSNVNVSVSNTGEGIPEDDIEHIFDRYFTKSKTGKEGVFRLLLIGEGALFYLLTPE